MSAPKDDQIALCIESTLPKQHELAPPSVYDARISQCALDEYVSILDFFFLFRLSRLRIIYLRYESDFV